MANLCHELRTPLQIITGYLDILNEDCKEQIGAEPTRILHRLRLSAGDLTRTVENLLAFGAAMTGTQAVVREQVDLAELVAELEPTFAALARHKKLFFLWRVERGSQRINSDRRLLVLIIDNLVSNALKFTDRGGVTVRLRNNAMKNGCALELEVRDTGIGMDEARLEEAFEPFVQLSNSSTREHRGLGLGLTLVRQAALALGAKVEVTSKLATGTVFRVRFPRTVRS
jgi:two-component system, sensor histidine kinase